MRLNCATKMGREVDPDECIKLDKEIAAVSGRDFDEEERKRWLATCNDL